MFLLLLRRAAFTFPSFLSFFSSRVNMLEHFGSVHVVWIGDFKNRRTLWMEVINAEIQRPRRALSPRLWSAPRATICRRDQAPVCTIVAEIGRGAIFLFTSKTERGQLDLWQGLSKCFCTLLAHGGSSPPGSSPAPSRSAPRGIVLFISRIPGPSCLFISHCFQAWTAPFLRAPIFVSWVSADGTRTPRGTSRDSRSDKDIFFLLFPPHYPLHPTLHPLQAPDVMKTKHAHLPSLSVSYTTASLYSLFHPPPPSHFLHPLSPSAFLTPRPMGVVSVPGGCQERQPISNQSSGQWLRQRSTLPFSEVLRRGGTEGACMYN